MTKPYQRSARRPRAVKVTVSLPGALLRSADAVGRAKGRTRSAVVQEALRFWLAAHEGASLAREYEAGYGRFPEGASEIAAAEAAAVALLSGERW